MKYLHTHPWLKFQLDLRAMDPEFWIWLGEAASKCEHLARVPLRPETASRLHQIYLAKGVMATTAIEGNTLSEEEVRKAVDGVLELPPSKQYLKREVENIIQACNLIGRQLADRQLPPITPELIRGYNKMVLGGLECDEDVEPGMLRKHSVVVGNVYRGAPAEDCDYLLNRLCQWLNENASNVRPGLELAHAIIRAILAHLYLAWIHPFGDGNGRTARLIEFHILLWAGVPSPAAHLLSNHYNQTRTEYYRQLDRASKSGGDVLPFIRYAVQGFVDGLRSQLEFVWDQQWDVTWRNFVHERFHPESGAVAARQRRLALDLGAHRDWVEIPAICELTPKLAREYAGKTEKTLQRDLNKLGAMGLIERQARSVRARREIILAFLPLRGKIGL